MILAIPDDMRAGKTMIGLAAALSAWYLLAERHRFRGPAFSFTRSISVPWQP